MRRFSFLMGLILGVGVLATLAMVVNNVNYSTSTNVLATDSLLVGTDGTPMAKVWHTQIALTGDTTTTAALSGVATGDLVFATFDGGVTATTYPINAKVLSSGVIYAKMSGASTGTLSVAVIRSVE